MYHVAVPKGGGTGVVLFRDAPDSEEIYFTVYVNQYGFNLIHA